MDRANDATDKPRLDSGFMVDVRIPPECMEDEGDCPHNRKPEKKQENPV